ncbi:MAG TPA: hypothetical protein P5307_18415, partial [Pirellulaceae bacterium]|nr:hypothetical protein [Pirellulaceae bacterium]
MNRNPSASASLGAAPMIDAEAIRSQHLSHEASVKSIGILYLLSAVFLVPAGLLMLASGRMLLVGLGAFYSAFGILQGAAGIGLRKLQDRDRYVAVCVAVIGLIGIPLGTIISGYILYLLLSKKGIVV